MFDAKGRKCEKRVAAIRTFGSCLGLKWHQIIKL